MLPPFVGLPIDSDGKSRLETLLRLIGNGLVYPVPVRGAAADCIARETHDWRLWITGTYSGRSLRLLKCADCETVEVRDVSLDASIGNARLARRPLNRLLGWYSGKARAGRIYT